MCEKEFVRSHRLITLEERRNRKELYHLIRIIKRGLYLNAVRLSEIIKPHPIPQKLVESPRRYHYTGLQVDKGKRRVNEGRNIWFHSFAEVYSLEDGDETPLRRPVYAHPPQKLMSLVEHYHQYGRDSTYEDSWDQCMILEDESNDMFQDHTLISTNYLKQLEMIGNCNKPICLDIYDVTYVVSPSSTSIDCVAV